MKNMSKIIAVLEIPESGDSAVQWFVDIEAMAQDPDPDCQVYTQQIKKALKSRDKMATGIFLCYDEVVDTYTVDPPCMIEDAVTLYQM